MLLQAWRVSGWKVEGEPGTRHISVLISCFLPAAISGYAPTLVVRLLLSAHRAAPSP